MLSTLPLGSLAPAHAAGVKQAQGELAMPAENRCRSLAGSALEGGKVVSARFVRDRASLDMGLARSPSPDGPDRPFCRVVAISIPAKNAPIHIEIWLPIDGAWNGKFFGTSNGGLEKIDQAELAGGVSRGYAIAAMDFGTSSAIGPKIYRVGIGNPELARNWSYRGVHMMTVVGKQVVTAFYRKPPSSSIFAGASGGGFQALGEASRYPDDYDGIIVGGPSINYANIGLSQGYRYVVSHRSRASAIPTSLLPRLAAEVSSQCDGIDGLVDGIIDDPRRCKVDFKPLACRPGSVQDCFQPEQIRTLEAIYGGLRDPRDGALIYPGFTPGGELSAGAEVRISDNENPSFINDDTPGPLIWVLGSGFTASQWPSVDFGADGDRYRAALLPYDNARPDLAAFAARGGKLVVYSGWSEANVNPTDVVDFFEAVQRAAGGEREAGKFARLFMAPGMYHHVGGPGPNIFGQNLAGKGAGPDNDLIMAMERWVEKGVAPDRIVATKFADDKPSGRVLRTRPLCSFPGVARWNGRGSIDDAEQFRCVDPE